jgi:class 3 adenylate cyclase
LKPIEVTRARRRAAARWCAVAAFALAALAAPFAGRVDLAVFDAEVAALRSLRGGAGGGEVVLVGIDDATLAATGEPLALSLLHAQLGRALEAIAQAAPRLTAIDVALPVASVESLRPGYDAALMRGLIAVREAGGVVATLNNDASGRASAPYAPFIAAAGEDAFGFALYPVDADNVVRRFDPARTAGAPSFLGRIAARLGLEQRAARAGYIDFTRGAPFDYVPLAEVARRFGEQAFLRARFAGKIVLIGSVLPYTDRLPQPVNLAAWEPHAAAPPGVVLNAQAVRTLLGRGLIRDAPAATALALAGLFAALALVRAVVLRWSALLLAAAASFAFGAAAHAAGVFVPLAAAWIAGGAAVALRTSADVLLARQERRRLTQTFGGYVSPQLLRAILDGRVDVHGGRRAMAFLFADLRGFTAWSERTAPEQVLAVLNRYYAAVTPIVHRHGGTIDNFRGDGIMVMFGAPEPHAAPCEAAFAAAREMVAAVTRLNRAELEALGAPLALSIGLAYGEAVYGDLGSPERKDFTAIGDAVNVAARLQELAKTLGFPVLMTAAFEAQLAAHTRREFAAEALGDAPLKGHSPVAIAGWQPAGA